MPRVVPEQIRGSLGKRHWSLLEFSVCVCVRDQGDIVPAPAKPDKLNTTLCGEVGAFKVANRDRQVVSADRCGATRTLVVELRQILLDVTEHR